MNTSNEGNNNDDFNNNPTNNDINEERRKKGKGRKKITMEKIENKANLQVTFSKRRAGAFKKASELSTLCGAESALVVYSPGNKPYSFGHPDVESVANRFLNNGNGSGSMQRNAVNHLVMTHGEASMHQRNNEVITSETQVERERKGIKKLDEIAPTLGQLNCEMIDHMKNFGSFLKSKTQAKLKGNGGESSSWANPGTHQNQGLGSLAPSYGYGVPTVPGGSSFTSLGDQFGHTLPYPPTGPSSFGFNYGNNSVNPVAVAPYDGMGRASGSGSGTWNMSRNNPSTDEDPEDLPQGPPDHGTGFGGNNGHSF